MSQMLPTPTVSDSAQVKVVSLNQLCPLDKDTTVHPVCWMKFKQLHLQDCVTHHAARRSTLQVHNTTAVGAAKAFCLDKNWQSLDICLFDRANSKQMSSQETHTERGGIQYGLKRFAICHRQPGMR